MAREKLAAHESSVNSLNAVRTSSSRLKLRGWENTYAPKSQKVKLADWLKENKFNISEDDALDLGGMTFADVKRNGGDDLRWLDTFLRDAIYDGMNSLTRNRRR